MSPDPDDKVRFPFGDSDEGSIDDLDSDEGFVDSDVAPVMDLDSGAGSIDDTPIRGLDSDAGPIPGLDSQDGEIHYRPSGGGYALDESMDGQIIADSDMGEIHTFDGRDDDTDIGDVDSDLGYADSDLGYADSDLGYADRGPGYADSQDGFTIDDSIDGQIVAESDLQVYDVDSDTGPIFDLKATDPESLDGVGAGSRGSGARPNIHETLPPDYPAAGRAPARGDATLPPNYPARGRAPARGEATLPPKYPAAGKPPARRDATLPPNYPAAGRAQGNQATAPPTYPAAGGPPARGEATLPPKYPAVSSAPGPGEATAPPTYPAAGHPPSRGQATLPPNYPAVGKPPAGAATEPPSYPAARTPGGATRPPSYPTPARGEATLPPNYPAPNRGQGTAATQPPIYPAGDRAATSSGPRGSGAGRGHAPPPPPLATQDVFASEAEQPAYRRPSGPEGVSAAETLLDADVSAADTHLDVDPRAAATHLDEPGASDTDIAPLRSPRPEPGGPPSEIGRGPTALDPKIAAQLDPGALMYLDALAATSPPPPPPAPRGLSSGAGSLHRTVEIEPNDISGWDAWDDYLNAFESAGDTPIIDMISGLDKIPNLDSESGEIIIPARLRGSGADFRAPVSGMGTIPEFRKTAPRAVARIDPERAPRVSRLKALGTSDTLWILLSLAGALLGPVLIMAGWDYYGLEPAMRRGHAWDRLLRSGDGMGLWFGIGASVLFLGNLTYVLRRRFFMWAKYVSSRLWLNVHFVCGLTGGSLILVHSSLLANNWIAWVSCCAIFVAILSGLFGRYVLSHIPRHEGGEATNLGELAIYMAQLRGDLRRKLQLYPKLRKLTLQALSSSAPKKGGARGIAMLPAMIVADFKIKFTTKRLEEQLRAALNKEAGGGVEATELVEETLEMVRLHGQVGRRLSQFEAVQDLMDTWRALHIILALVLVVTMFLHVTIVLRYSRISLFGASVPLPASAAPDPGARH